MDFSSNFQRFQITSDCSLPSARFYGRENCQARRGLGRLWFRGGGWVLSVSPGSSHAGIPGLVAGRRGAPFGRSSASGRHAQHPDGGGDAGAGLPRHQVRSPPPRRLGSFLPARPPGRGLPESLGIRPCVSCPLGEGGRRRACLTAVSCWNQGIINTISLLLLPPPPSLPPPPPPGLANKQAVTGSPGQGGAGPPGGRKGRPSWGAAGDTGTRTGTRAHTHWDSGRRRSDPDGPFPFSVILSEPQFPLLIHGDKNTLFIGLLGID